MTTGPKKIIIPNLTTTPTPPQHHPSSKSPPYPPNLIPTMRPPRASTLTLTLAKNLPHSAQTSLINLKINVTEIQHTKRGQCLFPNSTKNPGPFRLTLRNCGTNCPNLKFWRSEKPRGLAVPVLNVATYTFRTPLPLRQQPTPPCLRRPIPTERVDPFPKHGPRSAAHQNLDPKFPPPPRTLLVWYAI